MQSETYPGNIISIEKRGYCELYEKSSGLRSVFMLKGWTRERLKRKCWICGYLGRVKEEVLVVTGSTRDARRLDVVSIYIQNR